MIYETTGLLGAGKTLHSVFPPPSDTLWCLLTDGYPWSYVQSLPVGSRDRVVLTDLAVGRWSRIVSEAPASFVGGC